MFGRIRRFLLQNNWIARGFARV